MEEKKKITAGSPVAIEGLTLVPKIKTHLTCRRGWKSVSSLGFRQPIGVIIISPQGEKAFKVNGEEVALEALKAEFPGLEI